MKLGDRWLVLVLLIALVAIVCWILQPESRLEDHLIEPKPVLQTEPAVIPDPGMKPSPIEPNPFKEPVKSVALDITLLDLATGQPVLDAVIEGPIPEGASRTSNHLGHCKLECPGEPNGAQPAHWNLRLPEHLNSLALPISWPGDFELVNDSWVVRIPVYARLFLDFHLQTLKDRTHLNVGAMELPAIASDWADSDLAREGLAFGRSQNPTRFPYDAMKAGHIKDVIHGQASYASKTGLWQVLIPTTGEVVLTARGEDLRTSIVVADVVRGESRQIQIALKPFVTISGRLHLDGKPVADTRIHASIGSRFLPSEPSPQVEGDRAAWATWSKRNESGAWVAGKFSGQTDREGRFRFSVPYTDKVAVYTFLPGVEKAVWSWDLGDRETPVDAEINMITATSNRTMIVKDHLGNPMPMVRITPRIAGDIHTVQYPALEADAEGRVIINYLDEGQEYRGALGRKYFKFVAQNRGAISLPLGDR
jgi:hypothetical protein